MIVIVLDPGHYGQYNQGCSKQYWESVAMLKLAFMLKEELERTGKVKVILTRTDTRDLSLSARGSMAGKNGAVLFISLHTNAGSSSAKGAEAFYSVDLPNDKSYAQELSTAVANCLGTTNRGAKTRPSTTHVGEDYYGVIDSAQDSGCPHVFIIEHAFHTNPEDEAKLRDDNNLKKIAVVEAKVICGRHGVTYVPADSTPSTPPTPTTTLPWFRVRKDWADAKSQIGAFHDYQLAKDCVDANAGYFVFDESGNVLYPIAQKDYEKELIRVKADGTQVIALTGYTKCVDYANNMCKGKHVVLICVSDGKSWDLGTIPASIVEVPPTPTEPEPTEPTQPTEPTPEPVVVKHMVMGVAECTVEQCEAYLHKLNPNAPYYAEMYKVQCESEGVRFDIAFAQSCRETGNFKFGGDVKPEQNNFAGIGTTGGGVAGATFATPEEGILAQAQHLKAYASTEPLNKPCVDPRFNLVQRGKAPYIEDFGNGVWATSKDNYGGGIYEIVEKIKGTIVPPTENKQKEGMSLLEVFISALRKLFEFIIKNL